MKTIIKSGRKTYITTCERCGCEFSYQDDDIITEGDAALASKLASYKKFVECPFCNNNIFLRGTK